MTHIHLIKTKSNLTDEYQLNLWYNRYIKLLKYAETHDYSNTKHYHKHHILPKSLFPEYEHDQDNLIKLSYRLHYIAHYILWKLTKTYQMAMAFHYMSTANIKNIRLYNTAIKTLYEGRKGYTSATNILTGINELTKVENLGITHISTSAGCKWWMNEKGHKIFVKEDMSKFGYKNTHNNDCAPSKIYWTLDKNGNRCRTEDESKKISGVAPWHKGFNSINKERTKFINLITKETEYVLKNEKPERYHYRTSGQVKSKFYIFLFEDIYYFSYLALPRKIQFNLCRSLDVVNNKIPTMDSYLYKHSNKLDEPRKIMIEQHGGKTLKDLGLHVFYFYDPNFKFDFTKQFYDYENRNKHKHYYVKN